MIKRINITLGVIAIVGALLIGGVFLWDYLTPPSESSITQQIGGGMN